MSLLTDHHGAAHTVMFCDDGAELADAVTAHLGPALAGGGTAVVAATPEHLGRFAAGLGSAGVDCHRAASAGRLLELDAAAVATDLMVRGRLDRRRFEASVGALIAQRDRGRRAHPGVWGDRRGALGRGRAGGGTRRRVPLG